MCKKWSNRLALRHLRHGALSWADILQFQIQRVLQKNQTPTVMKQAVLDRFGEATRCEQFGWQENLECLPNAHGNDPQLTYRDIPFPLQGLSVFCLPKLLRYIARADLGLWQIDLVNSHPVHMLEVAVELKLKVDSLSRLVTDRLGVFQELNEYFAAQCPHVQLTRDDCKKLILATCYGGNPGNQITALGMACSIPSFLKGLSGDVRLLARRVACVLGPDKLQVVSDKDMPEISLLSHYVATKQRTTVEAMRLVPGLEVQCSFERDGFVSLCSKPDKLTIEAAIGKSVTVEPYPGESEILELLQSKYHFYDFRAVSRFRSDDLSKAFRCCVSALQPDEDSKGKQKFHTPKNTTDFGTLIASKLECTLFIADGGSMELYDKSGTYGKWKVVSDCTKTLQALVRAELLEFGKPQHMERQPDGKLVPVSRGDSYPQCKQRDFYVSVASDVSVSLYCTEPRVRIDSVASRRFLTDASGVVYDVINDRFYTNNPFIRTCRHTAWSFFDADEELRTPHAVWDASEAVKSRLGELLEEVFQFWLTGGAKDKSLHEDAVFGAPLAASLLAFVKAHPECALWQLLLPVFDENLDELLWYLCHLAADIFVWARRTEWRYFWGPASSGKDSLSLLAITFLGDRSDNGLATVFEPTYFLGKGKRDVLDCTLDTAKAMRLVLCNEIPEHSFWDHDRVKGLVEARGTGMVSRTIYKQPERWLPCCGLQGLGNHPLQMTATQGKDTGNRRRLNVLELRHVFDESLQKDIKEEIETGKFNKEIFHVCRLFYGYLKRLPLSSKRIEPRPPRVRSETQEVLEAQSRSMPLKDFIEDNCLPVVRYADATASAILKEEFAFILGTVYIPRVVNPIVDAAMVACGLEDKRCGSKRVLLYKFPDRPRPLAVQLKPDYERPDDSDKTNDEVAQELDEVAQELDEVAQAGPVMADLLA